MWAGPSTLVLEMDFDSILGFVGLDLDSIGPLHLIAFGVLAVGEDLRRFYFMPRLLQLKHMLLTGLRSLLAHAGDVGRRLAYSLWQYKWDALLFGAVVAGSFATGRQYRESLEAAAFVPSALLIAYTLTCPRSVRLGVRATATGLALLVPVEILVNCVGVVAMVTAALLIEPHPTWLRRRFAVIHGWRHGNGRPVHCGRPNPR